LRECVRLRVKDLDFDRRQVTVREGKGETDRGMMLPQALSQPLRSGDGRRGLQPPVFCAFSIFAQVSRRVTVRL
jgi:integrase